MKDSRFLILLLILSFSCKTGRLEVIIDIPNDLKEVSALERSSGSNLIWVIEDSGNKNQIYGLNDHGVIVKTIQIKNAKNKDWEDLTSDDIGNLYIGDFGDNKKKRKTYTIYKINGIQKLTDSANATRIDFRLPRKIKPKDFEAFFLWKDHFYIFSKAEKHTKLFKVPNSVGSHMATLVTEHEFDGRNNKITSADISEDGKLVVLLNHDKIWLLRDFKGDNFFTGSKEPIEFNHNSQKEGIYFEEKNRFLISEERTSDLGSNIYQLITN